MKSHSAFYYVPWILKPNNDILSFSQSILHVIFSMGHLLVWSQLSVHVFMGPLLGIFLGQFSFSCPLHVGVSEQYSCFFRL
jgi:hypothetical protein